MKKYFFILLSVASLSILTSCGADPTKCECDAELTRLLHSAVATGNTETTDLADKLQTLHQYHNSQYRSYCDDATRKAVIEHAIANNLFDQPTYLVYKQVNEVFTKLTFLDAILDTMGYSNSKHNSPMMIAIVDLFKYHKHRVNLEHYKLILTEDAPLEETLTEDTIDELETI